MRHPARDGAVTPDTLPDRPVGTGLRERNEPGVTSPSASAPPPRPRMAVHLTVTGALHVAVGAMGVLGAAMLLASGMADARTWPGILRLVLGAASALGLAGGVGLLIGASWARSAVLGVSVIYLLNLPFGTVLGIYSVWVLLHRATPEALAARSGA